MEWTMEWTDGMEYQLTKIAKTHHHGRGEVVSAVLPLLTSNGLLCLAGPCMECSEHGQGYNCVDVS